MFLLQVQEVSVIKRTFDLIIAIGTLLFFLPLIVLSCILIKLYDGGPIFYKSTRVGKDGKTFQMWKLRSMRTDAEELRKELLEEDIIRFKMKDDPRVTLPGKFIRKASIDEMPQLINVIKGDMSIVGPRPPIPEEVEKYSEKEKKRLSVPQGITCYWQVMGRNELSFEEQVDLDIKYIEEQSFLTDLKILLKTIPAVLSTRGAY